MRQELDDHQLARIATDWTQTEGFASQLHIDDAVAIVTAVRNAAAALPPEQALYLWTSPDLLVEPGPREEDLIPDTCEESDDR